MPGDAMSSSPSSVSPSSMPFAPGTVLAGKYRVERLLGEGGMGWVVVATHLQLEQRVALKFMHASHATGSPDAVGRFLREARAAARIQSEHVARVSDFGTLDNGSPYLVMEYLEGQDLDGLLQARGALPIALAIDYAIQACEGLAEAHAAGIVHRDLKPANLFLARRSDGSVRVKLLDFGISKLTPTPGSLGDVGMTSTQALMGSPLYMAPEQMRSSKSVDKRADIWSMGVILYEMLGGRAPFDADTLPEVCARIMAEAPSPLREAGSSVPAELEAVVMRCLEKDSKERFQDVAALAKALASFGTQDDNAAADRIARVVRGRDASSPNVEPVPSGKDAITVATSQIVQTAASFGTAAPAGAPRRTPMVHLALGGTLLAIAAIAVTVAVVATRGKQGDLPIAGTMSAAVSASPTATATPTPIATPTPTPTATPTPTPTPTETATPPLPVRPPAAMGSQHPIAKPKPSAKPASTSGFGGRD
jgi:eukaryotic-like serine/threonine-protein kinase